MKKIFFLLLISPLFFLFSCTEKIDVKLPNADKKIVIEGSIENGKYAEVIITRTIPLFSSTAGASPADFYVTDAVVTVSDGTTTETLVIGIDSSSSIGVVYKGNTIIGVPGVTYYLTVVEEGKTYTATTTIPTPVALDSVWWKPQPPQDTLGYANARISEPPGLGNNYRWYAKRPRDRRYLAPFGATWDDKYVDGVNFEFAYSKGYDPTDSENSYENDSIARGFYTESDTIYIRFCSINKEAKDFYTTFENALSNNGNPFASPVTILTNINGGALGVWAGFGATYDTIMPTP
jgi:hypothetical protein